MNDTIQNSRHILGMGGVTRVTCQEARQCFQTFYNKEHLKNSDHESNIITHILYCSECEKLFNEGMENTVKNARPN